MLTITSPIAEVSTHVFDPITKQYIHRLIDDLNLHQVFDAQIYYSGDHMGSSKSSDKNHNVIVNENRFNVAVKYVTNPASVRWPTETFRNAIGGVIKMTDIQSRRPCFFDKDNGTMLTEQEVPANIVMTCSMRFTNRIVAEETLARFITKYRYGEMGLTTDFSYDYPLPLDVLTVLYTISKLKGLAPKEFKSYLQSCSNNHITALVNRNDPSLKELVIQRNTFKTYSFIEGLEQVETEQINNVPNTFKIDFTVTLQFSRINILFTQYPIIVNNQYLPMEVVNVDPEALSGKQIPKIYTDNVDMATFYSTMYPNERDRGPIRYPVWDNWIVPLDSIVRQLDMFTFFIGALTIDDVGNPEGVTSIDLVDGLDSNTLTDTVIEALSIDKGIALTTNAAIHVAVFADDIMIDPSTLDFSDGRHIVIPNRDLNHIYRLVLSKPKEETDGTIGSFRVAIVDLITTKPE